MLRRIYIACIAVVMIGTVGLSTAQSARSEQDAGTFIMELADRALSALTDPELDNAIRAERFRELLQEGMDIPTVAARVLGPYVRRATDAEMAEFINLLEENIVRKYAVMFRGYSGEEIKLLETRDTKRDSQLVVIAVERTDGSPPVEVRWVVHDVDGRKKIIDIIVERVSMVTTQKEEFVSVIRRGGGKIEALLIELRERNAELATNIKS